MNIFVSNLSYAVTEDDLLGFFEEFGTVDSTKVIVDRETGRSRGFGFVEMANDEEAAAAIKSLNGSHVDGRAMNVNEAKPREERSKPSGRSYSGANRW